MTSQTIWACVNDIESLQYKAALAITGVISGWSKEKLYQELSLEHLFKYNNMVKETLFFL